MMQIRKLHATPSRRGFLRQLLGATFTGATVLDQAIFRAARARAQSAGNLPVLFDIEKVADGVYMALAKPQTLLNSNAVIFENARDLLIMDAHSKPSAVAALTRQIRNQITPKPIGYVVSSHFHWDHSHGLPAYRKIAPNANIIASETTRKLIDAETLPRLKISLEQISRQIENYKTKAGKAANATDKAHLERMAREAEAYLKEMRGYSPELPNLTVGRDLVLHDGAHDLHIAFRGRGHTAGDVVIYCPNKRTIATGDLLHGFFPFIGDGYPLDWPRTLLQVGEFPFQNIAGGHGGVFRSRDRLYQMANFIEEIAEQVMRGKRAGKSQAQMEAEITPASLKSVADGRFGENSVEAVLKYRMIEPPRPAPAQVLADSVKTCVVQIFAGVDRA